MIRNLLGLLLTATVAFAAGAAEGGHGPSLDRWKWLNFAILAGGLGYLISKTAGSFFRSRTEAIQRGIREATQLRQQAEARAADIERKMAGLAAEIAGLRAAAQAEMTAERERSGQEMARQLAKIEAAAGMEIASALKTARKQLKAYTAELALELARQRMRTRLTAPMDEQLVRTFAENLTQPGTGAQ